MLAHDERRQDPRVMINKPVILRHAGRLLPATVLNVSRSGMRLTSSEKNFIRNTSVEVIFDLDSERRDLSLRGRIIRVEIPSGGDIGIQFSNAFSTSNQQLESYLDEHLPLKVA
ncbi:MAG: hypothetical protein A3I05_02500 [Deltaproteobacteria bacterium RIFCSPLOWO2_02_FULL_44_10]|nr:MAG: hypothetical protein A3C46_03580 [Deltaproteobacteria bacterium RIFCSPHIGHO2_02_FULL_44_16]OGQ47723.1 MAG: hypothetical protein A3I05_02500 [Deltaproteobacteria bacterium RIFCSPLOWO2_02_FULL_44_10]